MAIYHLCIKIISRGKNKSAVAASAYRSGEKIKNEYDGIVHDFTRKGGIAHTEIPPAELILFESAKKYLQEHLGKSKTLTISKW